ncbi:hypothetical protein E8E11_011992 [Didymella keratinophila]|nr:hypothetical protein E8E11_011992 [Didymella keratinophila]
MPPAFVFQITEVREHQNVQTSTDTSGYWLPSDTPGYNVVVSEGASHVWWICNGTAIWSVPEAQLPPKEHYSTYSMFFSGGFGFRVLHGNATDPEPDKDWKPLGFEHDKRDGYSSFLTNVMDKPTLKSHRTNQRWVPMLLPNTYHGPASTKPGRGALKGELPIFLALMALSMPKEQVRACLPAMFSNGAWQLHNMSNGWEHKRGVIVTVYSVPGWAQGSAQDIENYEEGHTGKYYN